MTLEAVEQLVDVCQGREPCIAPGILPQVSFLADDLEIEALQAALRKFVGEPENYGLYLIPMLLFQLQTGRIPPGPSRNLLPISSTSSTTQGSKTCQLKFSTEFFRATVGATT
jgi:hypothetical protein